MRKAYVFTIMFLLLAAIAHAQATEADMANTMRANGKIYVVVLVLATIFAVIIAYLVRLDRKIKKLEHNK